jgi:NAD(P) transhydrogenase subunit alpha
MVRAMRPGSVIVDLAAETGGNVELTAPGQVKEVAGVWMDGTLNVPSTVPLHASQLYARNVANLLDHLLQEGRIHVDFDDEITRGCCVTYQGEVVHAGARELMKAAS